MEENKNLVSDSAFVSIGLKRIRQNKNYIIVVVGATGSGKSYAALSIAEDIDPTFDASKIAFKLLDFIKLVKSDMPKGSAIVFDEGGVEMQARNFMTLMNKALSYITQTMRYKNQIIIITVPDFSFIDVQVRKLVHMLVVTGHIDRRNKVNIVKPFQIRVRANDGKVFRTYPRVYNKTKGYVKIQEVAVHLPSVKLRHEYEKLKRAYTEQLYGTLVTQVGGRRDVIDTLTDAERAIYEAARFGVPLTDVAKQLGIKIRTLWNMRATLRRRGIELKDYKKKHKKIEAKQKSVHSNRGSMRRSS